MKFFVDEKQIQKNIVEIKGTDVNHIKNVLRKKKNDYIEVVCKDNNINYKTKIICLEQDYVKCEIVETLESISESNINVHIYQGLPKSDKMELIIQKCTELGVNAITPVSFKRSVVKLSGKDAEKKIDRWQKIAEVASKQSLRDSVMKINNIISVKNVCENIKKYDIVLVAYEKEEEKYLKNVLTNINNNKLNNIAIVIGPEGGIDDDEIEALKQNGAISISLGNRILRTETAPIVISSIIMYELGDIGGVYGKH